MRKLISYTTGLVLILLLIEPAAAQNDPIVTIIPCKSIFEATPTPALDRALGDNNCVRDRPNGPHEIYYPPAELSPQNELLSLLIRRAVINALSKLDDLIVGTSGHYNVLAMKVILIPSATPDIIAETFQEQYVDGDAPCPIVVSSFALTSLYGNLSDDEFKQIIAHEVFHCFQALNYGEVTNYAWWFEGSAEHFSNLVYPDTDYEHRHARTYNGSIAPFEHIDLGPGHYDHYSTTLFFQSLSQHQGDGAFLNFLQRQPREGGHETMHQALSNHPSIDEIFHQFTKDFLDRKVEDSSGEKMVPIVSAQPLPGLAPPTNQSVTFSTETPFHLALYSLKFESGYKYTITMRTSGAIGRSDARRAGEVEWGRLPPKIDACDQEKDYEVLLTSTAPPSENEPHSLTISWERERCLTCRHSSQGCTSRSCPLPTLSVEETEIAAQPVTPEIANEPFDQCLIGNWRLDPLSYRQQLTRLPPPNKEIIELDMSVDVSIAPDGLVESCITGFSHQHLQVRDTQMTTKLTTTGTTVAKIAMEGPNKFSGIQIRNTVIHHAEIQSGGLTFNNEIPEPKPLFPTNSEYRCAEDTLKVITQPPDVGFSIEHTYLRDN